jgi:hypothetical protein
MPKLFAQFLFDIAALQTLISDIVYPRFVPNVAVNVALPSTLFPDRADLLIGDDRTITAGADDIIDLFGGTLSDVFNEPFNAVEMVALIVKADPLNTGPLEIGGAVTNPWFGMFVTAAGKAIVGPGGVFAVGGLYGVGLGVVDAANANILIRNPGAAAATYRLGMIARSATALAAREEREAAAEEAETKQIEDKEARRLAREKAREDYAAEPARKQPISSDVKQKEPQTADG